MRAVKNNI